MKQLRTDTFFHGADGRTAAARLTTAARIACALLLGACLTGRYCVPVAWADPAAVSGDVTFGAEAYYASAWGGYWNSAQDNAKGGTASGDGSTAFGVGTTANTKGATAWGYLTRSGQGEISGESLSGDYTTAWGISSKALGTGATAWGGYIIDTEEHPGGTATGLGATAFGSGTWAEGTLSTVWGSGTSASGENATAWGYQTQATAAQATAWGVNTAASAAHATVWGEQTTASGEVATAFGYKSEASGYGATAWGGYYFDPDTKESGGTASGASATAFGLETKAISEGSTAFGYLTQAGRVLYGTGTDQKEASIVSYTETGNNIKITKFKIVDAKDGTTLKDGFLTYYAAYNDDNLTVEGREATAFGYRTKATGNYAAAFGENTTANATGSTAWGHETTAGNDGTGGNGGAYATAFGNGSKATGELSTAFGNETTASGKGATAFGDGSKATGSYATAFGVQSQAQAENSMAALGGTVVYDESDPDNIVNAKNSAAIGSGARVTVADTVALGSGSAASREKGAADAYLKGSNTGSAWVSTHNAIAVGNDDSVTRQITGVAAGSKETDAVNVAQLKAAVQSSRVSAGGGLVITGTEISVNAGEDFFVDSDKKLQLNKDGKVAANDQGVVTGGTVYQALQGKADASVISGLETRVSANEVSIDTLDTRMTTAESDLKSLAGNVSGLDKRVSENEAAIVLNTKAINKHEQALTKLDKNLNSDKVSIGKGSSATGKKSIAIGCGNRVTGDYSGAFGDPNTVSGTGSYAIGNDNSVGGNNTFVFGSGVTANVDDAVVLGNKSQAVAGAVSIGAPGKERQITNVAPGTVAKGSTDAVNGGQLWDLEQKINTGGGAGLQELDRKLTRDIREVGSRAAALAGLHPLPYDEDAPTTFNVAVGNYRGDTSVAVGMAHHFSRDAMLSVGGTVGSRPMLNAGLALRLGRYDEQVVEARKRKRRETAEKNRLLGQMSVQNAQIDEMKRDRQELKAELAQVKRERDRDREELEALRRRMELLEKRLSQPASSRRRGKK